MRGAHAGHACGGDADSRGELLAAACADAIRAAFCPHLRLLTKTREWNSAEERVRVAADCDGRGASFVALGQVMRGRENCSALRKGHLLHLARLWGYVSHLWCAMRAPRGRFAGALSPHYLAASG